MQDRIDAAAARLTKAQSVLDGTMPREERDRLDENYRPREEAMAAATDLLVVGVTALAQIAAEMRRANDRERTVAERRFGVRVG